MDIDLDHSHMAIISYRRMEVCERAYRVVPVKAVKRLRGGRDSDMASEWDAGRGAVVERRPRSQD